MKNLKQYEYELNLKYLMIVQIIILFLALGLAFFGLDLVSWEIGFFFRNLVVFVVISLIIHELIHGLCFYLGDKKSKKKIVYGLYLEKGIAYCQVKSLVSKRSFLVSLIIPFMILGFLPLIFSIILKDLGLLIISFFNSLASIADLYMFFELFSLDSKTKFAELDGPTSFNIITKEDLRQRKFKSFKLKSVKDYKKSAQSKEAVLTISKGSYWILGILIIFILLIYLL